jgi:hypothetical protein
MPPLKPTKYTMDDFQVGQHVGGGKSSKAAYEKDKAAIDQDTKANPEPEQKTPHHVEQANAKAAALKLAFWCRGVVGGKGVPPTTPRRVGTISRPRAAQTVSLRNSLTPSQSVDNIDMMTSERKPLMPGSIEDLD